MTNLSIVIVNWNCAEYTRQCIASLRENTKDLNYEILVVDNASTDDSLDNLRTVRDIRLISSFENLGFARANNLGAQQSSGHILLFLNPDTELLGPAINQLYAVLTEEFRFGALGCRLLNADGSLQTTCIQPFPTILNQLTDVERLKCTFPRLKMWGMAPLFARPGDQPTPVDAVSGACLMVRRSVFDQVGGFSTDYFMYGEDIDLCYKVKRAGWNVGYLARATIVHYGGRSSGRKDSGFGDIVMRDAVFIFLKKTHGNPYAFTYRLCMSIVSFLRLAVLVMLFVLPRGNVAGGYLGSAIRRWYRVFRWCVGLEPWAKKLRPLAHQNTVEIKT